MQLPLPEHEVARLEVLARYQIFGTPPEECFDNITHLAAYVCGTPIALISFIDQNSQWFKSRVGWDCRRSGGLRREIPRGTKRLASALKKYFAASDYRMVWAQRGTPRGVSSTVKSPEIVLPKLSAMVGYSLGAGY